MKVFNWNGEKNSKHLESRGITSGDIVDALVEKNYYRSSRTQTRRSTRIKKIFVVWVRDDCSLVPFIETEEEIFLKTIIPSRKYTKKHFKGGQDE